MYGKWTRVSHTEKTHKTLLASVRFGSALSAPPHCGQRRGHSCLLPDSELLLWDPDVISYFRSRADCNHLHTSIMSDVLKRDRGNVECVLCGRARQKKKKKSRYIELWNLLYRQTVDLTRGTHPVLMVCACMCTCTCTCSTVLVQLREFVLPWKTHCAMMC